MSQKIGRNAMCPCGSGKKYKLCCLDKHDIAYRNGKPSVSRQTLARFKEDFKKDSRALNQLDEDIADIFPREESFKEYIEEMLDAEDLGAMRTSEIIEKLKSMNVRFNTREFKKQVRHYISAIRLAEECYYTQDFTAHGPDEDFIWLAICELWKRFFPRKINIEMLDDAMQDGYTALENDDYPGMIKEWGNAWSMIKRLIPSDITSITEADNFLHKQLTQLLFNWCQDFETELHNAGLKNKIYFMKRIRYCREFVTIFPDTECSIMQGMFRSEAESYAALGKVEKAVKLFKRLINTFPNSVDGYIGLGDLYRGDYMYHTREKDKKRFINEMKAKEIYKTGLAKSCDDERDIFMERIQDLDSK